jgi:MoaA/NifB/PqqE/SkfB family radical SAM enzyme
MNGYDGVVRKWDIRPGNTCNLKCAMCNLSSSSKWIEDIDILKKYKVVAQNSDYDVNHGRENLDFDWIYSQCVDTAEFIYIAGGEPFYMKNVYNFLNKLSKHEWNCKNTRIQMVTNGVSNTPKFLDMLSRFKKIEFNISIDGWGDVNEIIRFPTDHNEFIRNADELVQLNPHELKFTATVQCMNLPNIDELVSNIKDRWNASYNLFLINGPEHLRIDSLKPQVIERVLETTKLPILKQFCSEYEYDESLNKTMQNYLLDLDAKRKTNSKEVLGWCFE